MRMIVGAETKTRARARMACRVVILQGCTCCRAQDVQPRKGALRAKGRRKSHDRTMMDPDAEMVIPRAILGV